MLHLIALFLIVSYVFFIILQKSNRVYPPGPQFRLPFWGHRLLTKKLAQKYGSFSKALEHLAEKYKTNVLGLHISGNYTVVVFSEQLLRKIFLGKEFQARPKNFFNTLRSLGTNKGITMTDGDLWSDQRTFLMKHLSQLGFGGSHMETLIQKEIKSLKDHIGEGKDDLNISGLLALRTINVLWHMVAGEGIADNNKMRALLELMNRRSKAFDIAGGNLCNTPFLRFIAPEYCGYNLIVRINEELNSIISETIKYHKSTYKESVTRDYIDAFLHEMNKNKDSFFTDDQLLMMCIDLFIAGLQTTTHSLEFFIIRLVLDQDIQKKMQAELDSVLQPNELVTLKHREKLPYTMATISELLRIGNVIPITGPRRVLCDTTLDGYFIPKGTTILLHMASLNTDAGKWDDPHTFKPERFLENCKDDVYYPFSYGKRRCPGEILARSFIFIFLAGLFHKYSILPPEGRDPPSLDPVPGITNTPKPYSLKFVARH